MVWMANAFLLCVILVTRCALGETVRCLNEADDPCHPDIYINNNDHTRSLNYRNSNEPTISDNLLYEGWYRFTSLAGGDMPDVVPDLFSCQSLAPIYLTGDLPGSQDGIVTRTTCTRYMGDECANQYNICIKNCTSFNVYYLKSTDDTKERYCFGTETPCPPNQVSSNGFSPGCREVPTTRSELTNEPRSTTERPIIARPTTRRNSPFSTDVHSHTSVTDGGTTRKHSGTHAHKDGGMEPDQGNKNLMTIIIVLAVVLAVVILAVGVVIYCCAKHNRVATSADKYRAEAITNNGYGNGKIHGYYTGGITNQAYVVNNTYEKPVLGKNPLENPYSHIGEKNGIHSQYPVSLIVVPGSEKCVGENLPEANEYNEIPYDACSDRQVGRAVNEK